MLAQIVFTLVFIVAVALFTVQVRKIIRNIRLGKNICRNDRKAERWTTMARVAMGQSKMMVRPVAGLMHLFVYLGFVIINLEVLEIVLDGIFGTHRLFAFMGGFYSFLIGSFEILAGECLSIVEPSFPDQDTNQSVGCSQRLFVVWSKSVATKICGATCKSFCLRIAAL